VNQLEKVFEYQNRRVRTVAIDNEPWFVATDVCTILDITNPTMAVERLDDDERSKFNLGRQGEAIIVNEPGLYSLILGSRKPEAKTFRRWITHEVVPSIRKIGSYSKPFCMEDVLIQQLQTMKEMRVRLETTESKVQQLENKLEKRLTEDAEKQLVTPSQLGKMFEPALSAKAVNAILRDVGLHWKVGGEWIATAEGRRYSSSEPVQLASGKMVYQLKWQRRVVSLLNTRQKAALG